MFSKKKRSSSWIYFWFLHFRFNFIIISQEGSSLLKSCACRSFLRVVIYNPSQPIHIVLATHFWVATHGLRNTALMCLATTKCCACCTEILAKLNIVIIVLGIWFLYMFLFCYFCCISSSINLFLLSLIRSPMFCFNLSPIDNCLWRLCFATQQVSDQTNFKYKIVIYLGKCVKPDRFKTKFCFRFSKFYFYWFRSSSGLKNTCLWIWFGLGSVPCNQV